MSKNPEERHQGYAELLEGLAAINSGSGHHSKIEARPGRLVLTSQTDADATPTDPMSIKQLSVADVNLELGRYQKALSLYRMVLQENPQLEVELAFRMLRIHQQLGDREEMQRLYQRIGELTPHAEERFFCHWKLLAQRFQTLVAELQEARASLGGMISSPLPEGLDGERLQKRHDELESLEKKLIGDYEGQILLVRKTGDLQIELD